MGGHENGRELHIRAPWIDNMVHGEAMQSYESQVHKTLNESKVPTIAAKKQTNQTSPLKT